MRAAIASYRATRVESASKPRIVLMLFQEAARRLELALVGMEANDANAWRPHLHHVREILLELRQALQDDAAPELCGNLRRLYLWCNEELIAAGRESSQQRVRNVLKVTTVLAEGWQGAVDQGTI